MARAEATALILKRRSNKLLSITNEKGDGDVNRNVLIRTRR